MEEVPTTDQLFENPDLLSKFLEDITVETSTPLGERLSLESVDLENPGISIVSSFTSKEIKDSLLLLGKREEELKLLSDFVSKLYIFFVEYLDLLISKTEEQLGSQQEKIELREQEILQLKNELASAHDENSELKLEMKYKKHDDFSKAQEAFKEKMDQKDHEILEIKRELMAIRDENTELKVLYFMYF